MQTFFSLSSSFYRYEWPARELVFCSANHFIIVGRKMPPQGFKGPFLKSWGSLPSQATSALLFWHWDTRQHV